MESYPVQEEEEEQKEEQKVEKFEKELNEYDQVEDLADTKDMDEEEFEQYIKEEALAETEQEVGEEEDFEEYEELLSPAEEEDDGDLPEMIDDDEEEDIGKDFEEDDKLLEMFDDEEEEVVLGKDSDESGLLVENVDFCEPADEFDHHCDNFTAPPHLFEDDYMANDPDVRRFLESLSDEENDSNGMKYISNETLSSDQDHCSLKWWKAQKISGHKSKLVQWVKEKKIDGVTLKQIYDHHPVFDYDDQSCFPSINADVNGNKNPGEPKCKPWLFNHPNYCRPKEYMHCYSNTYHKMGRFCYRSSGGRDCVIVHLYILYFQMDYDNFCTPLWGHNHDAEKVMYVFKDGSDEIHMAGVSAHGKIDDVRRWGQIPCHKHIYPKVKYDKGWFTRAFEWASSWDEKVSSHNPNQFWTTPEIVTLDLMTDRQKRNIPVIAQEDRQGWPNNYLYHMLKETFSSWNSDSYVSTSKFFQVF